MTWDEIDQQQWPELTEWAQLMPTRVSPDFVERTCQRVIEDQQRIAEEAERVDEIQFPERFFAAYGTPEPSVSFTARLMARMRAGEDPPLVRLMSIDSVPEPSQDFVERTLAALRVPRLRALPSPPAARLRILAPWAAAAAILVVALLAWPRPSEPPTTPTAAAFSASPSATAMAGQIRARDVGSLNLRAADPLLMLARGALTEEDE